MTDPTGTDPIRAAASRDETARRATVEAERAATSSETRGVQDDEASKFATHGDPTVTGTGAETEAQRAGVQWVRPTDLAARAGGAVVDRGAQWNALLHEAALDGIREGRAQLHERLAQRQDDLEPATTTSDRAMRPVAERTGVSR